jgi:hypothetical protein
MEQVYNTYIGIATPFFNIFTICLLLHLRRSKTQTIVLFFLCWLLVDFLAFLPILRNTPVSFVLAGIPFIITTLYLCKGTFWQKMFVNWFVINNSVLICFGTSPIAQLLAPYKSDGFYLWLILFMTILYITEIALTARFLRNLFPQLFSVGDNMWVLYTIGTLLSREILRLIVASGDVIAVVSPPPLGSTGLLNYYLVILASLWCFIVTCIIIVTAYKRARVEYELRSSENALTAAYNHYKTLSHSLDEADKLRHDIKYILSTIQELAHENDNAQIIKLLKYSPDYHTKRMCEHHIVNALLNWYAQRCRQHPIALDVHLFMPNDMPVDAMDLCVVLGNLLENAYENCLAVPGGGYIRIHANAQPDTLMINIVNSFDGRVNIRHGELQTRKDVGGIGLKSIHSVCKKYGGECLTSWTENEFSVAVYLNFKA